MHVTSFVSQTQNDNTEVKLAHLALIFLSPIVSLADLVVLGQGRQSLCSDGCWCMLFGMLLLLSVLSRKVESLLCCREKMMYGYQLLTEDYSSFKIRFYSPEQKHIHSSLYLLTGFAVALLRVGSTYKYLFWTPKDQPPWEWPQAEEKSVCVFYSLLWTTCENV